MPVPGSIGCRRPAPPRRAHWGVYPASLARTWRKLGVDERSGFVSRRLPAGRLRSLPDQLERRRKALERTGRNPVYADLHVGDALAAIRAQLLGDLGRLAGQRTPERGDAEPEALEEDRRGPLTFRDTPGGGRVPPRASRAARRAQHSGSGTENKPLVSHVHPTPAGAASCAWQSGPARCGRVRKRSRWSRARRRRTARGSSSAKRPPAFAHLRVRSAPDRDAIRESGLERALRSRVAR